MWALGAVCVCVCGGGAAVSSGAQFGLLYGTPACIIVHLSPAVPLAEVLQLAGCGSARPVVLVCSVPLSCKVCAALLLSSVPLTHEQVPQSCILFDLAPQHVSRPHGTPQHQQHQC
jgi:hypothetical protein